MHFRCRFYIRLTPFSLHSHATFIPYYIRKHGKWRLLNPVSFPFFRRRVLQILYMSIFMRLSRHRVTPIAGFASIEVDWRWCNHAWHGTKKWIKMQWIIKVWRIGEEIKMYRRYNHWYDGQVDWQIGVNVHYIDYSVDIAILSTISIEDRMTSHLFTGTLTIGMVAIASGVTPAIEREPHTSCFLGLGLMRLLPWKF